VSVGSQRLSSSNISRCLTRGAPTFDIFVAGVIALILAPTNIVAVALEFHVPLHVRVRSMAVRCKLCTLQKSKSRREIAGILISANHRFHD
jgi:site-specific recombinase